MKSFLSLFLHKQVQAFTLLEVLTSLSIVTLVIMGPLTFSVNSAAFSKQSKDVLTSMYLAQESLELLHFQYDTLYIACSRTKDACDDGIPLLPGESLGGKAWRLFKTRLADTSSGSASCFSAGGCAFDFLDMTEVISVTPPKKYDPAGTMCPKLSIVESVVNGYDTTVRNYYVCSSIDQSDTLRLKDNHFNVKKTAYGRVVKVESVPTFTETNAPTPPANLGLYQDDLIITSTVSFRKSNGVMRDIKVVDFFHPRS
jgi:hypothetical protein